MVGDSGAFRPWDSEFSKALQGVSRCPQGVAYRAPSKNSSPRSGCQNATRAPRRVALVGCAGEVRPRGSEWGMALRGASKHPQGVECRVPPKNSPEGPGAKMPQGPRDGWAIALVQGARTKFICQTRNGARLCEGPQGTHGESRPQPSQKIATEGPSAERPQGPRDGWAKALPGARGRFIRRTRNGAPLGSHVQSPVQK